MSVPPPPTVPAARIGAPGFRGCCLFTPEKQIFTDDDVWSPHRYGSSADAYGIIYTSNGGFIDIAHLRDVCDLTRYYYLQLMRGGGKKDLEVSSLRYGKVIGKNGKVYQDIPPTDLLQVAGRLAYLESVFHEIESYWWIAPAGPTPGMHNSAFSPEDLVSNHLGARLGIRALQAMEAGTYSSYNDAVTDLLPPLLGLLGAENGTRARTLAAYNLVEDIWYTPSLLIWFNLTLNRRNFGLNGSFNTINPWIVPYVPNCPAAVWPAAVTTTWPSVLDSYVQVDYYPPIRIAPLTLKAKIGEEAPNTGFEAYVTAIRQDAATRYGPKFDSPALV